MDITTGYVYPSRDAALSAGSRDEDIVQIAGTLEQAERLGAGVRALNRAERLTVCRDCGHATREPVDPEDKAMEEYRRLRDAIYGPDPAEIASDDVMLSSRMDLP